MTQHELDLPPRIGFKVSARTVQMLGRENVSSPIVALTEIIKNSYDADANSVWIEFQSASSYSGVIRIYDDGEGMTFEDLRDKWLVIATDNKLAKRVTRRKKRAKVGEKGIGRLALDRLAESVTVITRHKDHRTLQLEIDWTRYDNPQDGLEEIKHPISVPASEQERAPGTELILKGLRDRWTQKMYRDLHSDLSLLVAPFESNEISFRIIFECDEAPELSGEITNPLLEKAEYKLDSKLDEKGEIKHLLTYQPTGEISHSKKKWHEEMDVSPDTKPACGPIHFKLYFYVRDKEKLRELNVKRADLDKFLSDFQGIRIYRDGFRVKPYGDPSSDEDWLGLNAKRVSHPAGIGSFKGSWSLAENQVVGSVQIARADNPELEDQTNREGLIQNQAYLDFRNFLLSGINFIELERQARYRRDKRTQQEDPLAATDQATNILANGIGKIRGIAEKIQEKDQPTAARLLSIAEEVEKATSQIGIASDLIAEEQTEKQLLVGLATLGIAIAAFGHETVSDVNMVVDKADLLKDVVQALPSRHRKEAVADLQALIRAAERVKNWGQFALARIKRSKRVPKEIDINSVVEEIIRAFKYTLDTLSIRQGTHLPKSIPKFYGFEMDIESILINFITNSVEAMRFTPLSKREIQISTNYLDADNTIRLRFLDSGKGIPESDEQKIFSPLYSTKLNEKNEPIGTGMGLTIVRDAVQEYGGEINVKGKGKLGGAEFEVLLPVSPNKPKRR
ncbi:MAG: sensor histidine kinase [Chloroflexi bacterium]|nr:sensor histidine kinase [Chloroflexota bacterium]